ncbi:MAG: hypothetical protein NTW21_03020 [Verrucomicrobia bacterium]|nr:hypothetical protein [Verrucomicrobiota bacterium]
MTKKLTIRAIVYFAMLASAAAQYLKDMNWNQNDLDFGKNGIAALTSCDVPIANGKESVR